MVAVTVKEPGSGQVYEQSVVAFGAAGLYGVPGPSQLTVVPSPMSKTTSVGVAVAVVVTGPALAEADRHPSGLIHSHDARPTSWGEPSGGAISITGEDRPSCLTACSATTTGSTWAVAAAGTAPLTQNGGIGSITPGPRQ